MSATQTPWIKASASGGNGNCVEMRQHGEDVEVRDSKDAGNGPILRFTPTEWSAWLDGAKNGEFDHLGA
jgi:Domain of unknown function (DUF397)